MRAGTRSGGLARRRGQLLSDKDDVCLCFHVRFCLRVYRFECSRKMERKLETQVATMRLGLVSPQRRVAAAAAFAAAALAAASAAAFFFASAAAAASARPLSTASASTG